MMLTEGIILGHHISSLEITVDPAKIQIIVNLLEPINQKDVRSFLGMQAIVEDPLKILVK